MGMKEATTRRIYNLQSHFYDQVFGNKMQSRMADAIRRMNIQPGERVLDIGIGTGVSLELYPRHCQVTGIDISEGMLAKAQDRVRKYALDNVLLARADAMLMPFPDHSFDRIFFSHVITVVSDPQCLLEHIKRVGKPGCQIVMINHFQSGNRVLAWLEEVLSPFFVHLGWRSDLNLYELLREADLEVNFRYKTRGLDLWDVVFMRNAPPRLGSYQEAMAGLGPAVPRSVGRLVSPSASARA